ncbi:MAG: magnesium chelatase, partial [Balneolales bacterium]
STYPDPRQKKTEGNSDEYQDILSWFSAGNSLELPDLVSDKEYQKALDEVGGLSAFAKKHSLNDIGNQYPSMDFIVEALHQQSMLGKEDLDEVRTYNDMLGSMLGGMGGFEEGDFTE